MYISTHVSFGACTLCRNPNLNLNASFQGFDHVVSRGENKGPRLFIFILVGTFSSFTKIKNKERERERGGPVEMAVFKNIGEISHFSGKFPFFQRGGGGEDREMRMT